ncbi:hypothetical protein CfE428DRAFT_1040 [Chthoniobacter flavus Ellin428]|uniref:FAD dependent oxidoreductase n=1 Tax=Chthoniobacter flavus Ellin428 TaxID=497964 RepID=B4CWK2_9BACT|nr:hypothetical protein CfE428DRAFT_1040 [Chthoniobacter flavus Ellin428]
MLALAAASLLMSQMPASAATTRVDHTDESIVALHDHQDLSDAEYWQQNATPTGKCDGGKVAKMLVEVAKVFQPVTTSEEAIDVLSHHGVIGSPDAWRKGIAPGQTMSGANVATVLNRCAVHLPIPPPKSANATPLEATPPAQLKDSYDIVVAGAGTGGVGVAVQAARMGRSVLLLEETDWIGGQMNAAAVTSMDEGVALVRERGLYRELCGLIAAHYQPLGINYMTAYWNGHVCVEPCVGKQLLHVLLGDARGKGVLDLALRTRVTQGAANQRYRDRCADRKRDRRRRGLSHRDEQGARRRHRMGRRDPTHGRALPRGQLHERRHRSHAPRAGQYLDRGGETVSAWCAR